MCVHTLTSSWQTSHRCVYGSSSLVSGGDVLSLCSPPAHCAPRFRHTYRWKQNHECHGCRNTSQQPPRGDGNAEAQSEDEEKDFPEHSFWRCLAGWAITTEVTDRWGRNIQETAHWLAELFMGGARLARRLLLFFKLSLRRNFIRRGNRICGIVGEADRCIFLIAVVQLLPWWWLDWGDRVRSSKNTSFQPGLAWLAHITQKAGQWSFCPAPSSEYAHKILFVWDAGVWGSQGDVTLVVCAKTVLCQYIITVG